MSKRTRTLRLFTLATLASGPALAHTHDPGVIRSLGAARSAAVAAHRNASAARHDEEYAMMAEANGDFAAEIDARHAARVHFVQARRAAKGAFAQRRMALADMALDEAA